MNLEAETAAAHHQGGRCEPADHARAVLSRHSGSLRARSDLRRWGLKLAERGGKNAKKRAVVAVARKLRCFSCVCG